MQVLQRSFSILLTVFFLIFAVTLIFEGKEINGYKQWEKIQVNRFLQQISKEGKCTYREYQLLYEALNQFGITVEIILKEYQKELDVEGTVYWYLISWEEIREILLQKEEYTFQKNSVLELCVTIKKENIEKQEKYYILSKGRKGITYLE